VPTATVLACAALGLLVGAFLPRLVHTLARLSPRGLRSPLRLAELSTAAVFAVLAARIGPEPELPAFLYVGAVGVALAFVDVDCKRLPDVFTLPSYAIAAVLLGLAALVGGEAGAFMRALGGMAALYAFFFLLVLVHPAGMGFGDVKLAGLLGLYLGWLGWRSVVSGAFLGFLLGGLTGMALLVAGRATRRSSIPFGPYMLLGALLAVTWGEPLAEVYLGQLTGTA
jgi:leader peptidase (prepilin peptidase) / N-methyltransferase